MLAASNLLGAMLTATTGDVLDPENATFISTTGVTLTFIPIARESGSAQRLVEEFLKGNNDEFAPILLGVMVVDQHPTFPQGVFQAFLTPKGLQLVDQDGQIVVESIGSLVRPDPSLGSTLAEGPFDISFDIEERPASAATATVDGKSSCGAANIASVPIIVGLKCEVKRICNKFTILGYTIWESCQDVLVCQ